MILERHEVDVRARAYEVPPEGQFFHFEVNFRYHFDKENYYFNRLRKIIKKDARVFQDQLSIQQFLTNSLELVTNHSIGEPVGNFSATKIPGTDDPKGFPGAIKAAGEQQDLLIFGYSSPLMVDDEELEIPRAVMGSIVSFDPTKDRLTLKAGGETKSYRYSKITWLAKGVDWHSRPKVVRYSVLPLANGKLKFIGELFENYEDVGIKFLRRRGGAEPFELPPEELPRRSKVGVDMEFLKSCLDKRVELRDGNSVELFRLSAIGYHNYSSSVTLTADNGTKFSVNLKQIELEQQ